MCGLRYRQSMHAYQAHEHDQRRHRPDPNPNPNRRLMNMTNYATAVPGCLEDSILVPVFSSSIDPCIDADAAPLSLRDCLVLGAG